MEIYIEYAFIENFLFDGVLLSLALFATRTKLVWWRILLSACMGAVFAIFFPLLRLPKFLGTLLKIAVGCLLCMIAVERLKTKKEWGRYALSCVFFFCLSFGFGGALLGVYGQFDHGYARIPSMLVFFGFSVLSGGAVWLIRKLYQRKRIFQSIYPCVVGNGEVAIQTQGFLDSGNLAMKNGLPICFVSIELFYELFSEEILSKGDGQVCDEMQIRTMSGVKTVSIYQGELEMEGRRRDVYFSPTSNMIGREYKILLNARILEKDYEVD